jgi:nicotinate-nucleotide pyrophosphorylase
VDELDVLAARALAEDLGAGDVTAEATVPAGARARAQIVQKARASSRASPPPDASSAPSTAR